MRSKFQLSFKSTCGFGALLSCLIVCAVPSHAKKQELTSTALYDLTRKIEKSQFAKASFVESLTGRHLTSQGYWHWTSDQGPDDLVTQVEMTNDRKGITKSVLLYVNKNLHISPSDVKRDFMARPKVRPHPEPALKHVTFLYDYERKSGWTDFWFEGEGAKAEVRYMEVTYKK